MDIVKQSRMLTKMSTTRTPQRPASPDRPLHAVPDPEPGLMDRVDAKIREHGGDPRKVKRLGRNVLLGVGLGAAVVVGALNFGSDGPKDARTEQNAKREDTLLKAFLDSGKVEAKVGDATVTTMKGKVTITPTGSTPINLRESIGWQNHRNMTDEWDDNIGVRVGYNHDEDRDNFVVMVDPIVATFPNGDQYMGGLMADENGELPEVDSIDEFIERAHWAFVSGLQEPYSGATVDIEPSPDAAPYAVSLDGGALPSMYPAHMEPVDVKNPDGPQQVVYGT